MPAPTTQPSAAPSAPSTGAVAGAAGAGAATLAGGPPGSLAAVLQQLVTTIQGLVAALGGSPVTGGGASTGSGVVQQIQQSAANRQARVQQLSSQLAAESNQTGAVNQVQLQMVKQEQIFAEHLNGLAAKLAPIAGTIDQAEAASIMQVVQQAEAKGRFDASSLVRIVTQVDGSAKGLPAQFLASAGRFADVLSRHEGELNALTERIAAAANQTGTTDQAMLAQVTAKQQQVQQLNEAFKRVFDSAAANPAVAQQKVDAAIAQSTIEGSIAALA